jgi:CRISPR-associated protein Csy2
VRFPYKGEYLSITPVVNHGVQIELERLARSQSSSFRFIPTSLPHPASIGNLCGSLGGNMRLLNYPIGIQPRNDSSLFASRNRTQRYFDDYQLTDKRACSVLAQLCGHHSKITRQKQVRSRKQQVAMLRKQIALWMLPLIELKERVEQDKNTPEIGDELAHRFVYVAESDLPQLQKELVQRVHHALQSNKYSRRYAYHQKLIQPIRTQIEWVLQQLAKPEGVEEKNTEEEQYIYLSSMRLQEGQAQSSPYLIGMPSLTAFWGFMHRFQLNLQKSGIEFEGFSFDSFSLFVREEHIYQSAKLSEPNAVTKIREISAAKRPTTRTDYYTDLVFDMVVKVKGNGRLSDDISSLKAALPTHLAGGTLFPPKIDSEINWIQTFVSRSSLYFQLKGLDACGSWVMPTESEPASLSGLQSLLLNDSTLIAASTGFRLLELPKERINALTKKHSYVENVLGVAKVVNPIEVRMSGLRHFFSSAFWSLQIESESILIKKQKSE